MAEGETPEPDPEFDEVLADQTDEEAEPSWSILDGHFDPEVTPTDPIEVDRIANSTLDYPENIKTRIQVFLALKHAFDLSGVTMSSRTQEAKEIQTYILDSADFCNEFFSEEYMHTEEGLVELTPELDEQPPAIMTALEAVLKADRTRYAREVFRAGLRAEWQYLQPPNRPDYVIAADRPRSLPIKGDARRYSRAIIRMRYLEENDWSREQIIDELKTIARAKSDPGR